MRLRAVPGLLVELQQPALALEDLVQRLLGPLAGGQASPVGVVVLAGAGVDEHLDVAVAGDVGEGVRHVVMRLPVPHQASAVGVALHEQDAVVAQLEPVVGVLVLVLAVPRALRHQSITRPPLTPITCPVM